MEYSIPYVILLLFLEVAAIAAHRYRENYVYDKCITMICLFVLLVFFGFRGYICDDWTSYVPLYDYCTFEHVNFLFLFEKMDVVGKLEPGFAFLMCVCKAISNGDYVFFQFVCSLINLSLIYSFLNRHVKNIPFGLMLFICFGGYVMMTNLLRNSISILIAVNAFDLIQKRKPLSYFGCCTLALMFHVSAILYYPLYFFMHRKLNRWIWLGIFMICNVIFILHIGIISQVASSVLGLDNEVMASMIASYTESYDQAKGISIGYLERVFSGILVFCLYDRLIEHRNGSPIYTNMFLMYIMLSFLLSEFAVLAERIATLVIASYWIVWHDILKVLTIRNNKLLFASFVSLYCTFKIIGLTSMITSEYDNHLFGAKSYQERLSIHNKNSKGQ